MRNINIIYFFLLNLGISMTLGAKVLSPRPQYDPSANVEAYADFMVEDVDSNGFLTELIWTCSIFGAIFQLFILIYILYVLISLFAKCCGKCLHVVTCGIMNCEKMKGQDGCCSCKRCCVSCVPSQESTMTTDSSGSIQLRTSSILLIIVYSLYIGAFISIHVIFSGSSDINDGIDAAFGSLTDLKDQVFGGIGKEAQQMIDGPTVDKQFVTNSNCYSSSQGQLNPIISAYDAIILIAQQVKDLASGAEDGLGSMADYGDIFKAYAWNTTQIVYGIQVLFILIVIILIFLEWKCSIKYFQLVNVILNLQLVLIVLTIFLAISLAGSKFCLLPNQNVIDMMAGSSDLIEFYLARDQDGYICYGDDELVSFGNDLGAQGDNLKTEVSILKNNTGGTSDCDDVINSVEQTLEQYNTDLAELFQYIDCPTIHNIFTSMLEDGLCSGIVTGIGTVWVSLFFAFVFQIINIYLCVWLGSYFDEPVIPKVKDIFNRSNASKPTSTEMVPSSPVGDDQIRPTTKVTPL